MNVIKKKTIRKIDEHRKGLFWMFAGSLFLCASLYIYFVNTATLNTIRRGRLQAESAKVLTDVSLLEERYLSLKQKVTLSLAYREGFRDVQTIRFIERKPLGAVVSNREI